MTTFLFTVIGIWLIALVAWLLISKTVRKADMDRLKGRLIGKQQKTAKGPAQEEAALFAVEEPSKGKIVLGILERYKLNEKLKQLLEQAGLKWNPGRFIHSCMAFFIGCYVIMYLTLPDQFRSLAIFIAIFAGFLPLLYVLRLKNKRIKAFEEIFPDSLEFISRSMRAGHAFSVSLEMIHREFQEPLAGEFRRTFEEHNLGLPLDVALQSLSKRVPLLDVHFFVSAVLLQKRTGGNLAEILDKLAYIIRERFKLRGRIRAISAHGKLTGIALTCIPIGVAIMMFFTNPDYVKFFFQDETGNIMLGVAAFLQVAGYLIMKKIVTIEV
ncbi:MAG: type II secretion system F family protein [Bryobacteraceae bacterium]